MVYLFLLLWFTFIIRGFSCIKVVTKLGDVEGFNYLLGNGETIFAFLGIPYAIPPLREYRFEEPRPVEKWQGTWMAKASGSACLQPELESGRVEGSEDCLYLNIYTPTVSRKSALPVMAFIHGGSFLVFEGGKFTPRYLMNRTDFIFVTMNYRLGPLGFLSTEDSQVPGNNGLKDQAMALRWIQDNIDSFGGDKNKVTILGQSAGGASVQLHYLSPWSQGLFRNGISASGTALNPWAFNENPLEKARKLAASVGCPTISTPHMVRCLKDRPGDHLFHNLSSRFRPWHGTPFAPFGPVIERAGNNPFLNEHPYHLLSKGRVQDKPWLLSLTTEEGLYPGMRIIQNKDYLEDLEKNWHSIAPYLLDYNCTMSPEKSGSVSETIMQYYFGSEKRVVHKTNVIIKMLSERLFKSGIGEAALLQASVMKSPVYLFSLGFMFNYSYTDKFTKIKFGVSHADDVLNIFWNRSAHESADTVMASMLINIWISFMNDGIPSIGRDIIWSPVIGAHNNSIRYLNITSPENITMTEEYDFGNQQLWNSLGLNENSNYYNEESSLGNALTVTFFVIFACALFNVV